jgi:hypothetical protein
MNGDKIIRINPLFEFYVENEHVIVANADYSKVMCNQITSFI